VKIYFGIDFIIPMRLGVNREMFSFGSSRAADLVRLEGVDTEPFGASVSARAAFCRRVRALILCVMKANGLGLM
jgi:hypothetical protein